MIPAPVNSFQPVPRVWRAERVSTSATCSDARRGSTSQTSEAMPETIGAAKLVPSPYAKRSPPWPKILLQEFGWSHSVFGDAGNVDSTPKRQSPVLAPGPDRLTYRLCVENSAGAPFGRVAATDSPIPGAPWRPPTTAAGYCTGLTTPEL